MQHGELEWPRDRDHDWSDVHQTMPCTLTTFTTGEAARSVDESAPNSRLLLVRNLSSQTTKHRFGTGRRPLGVLAVLGELISVALSDLFHWVIGSDTVDCCSVAVQHLRWHRNCPQRTSIVERALDNFSRFRKLLVHTGPCICRILGTT